MAARIADWQARLDREGAVVFQESRRRTAFLLATSVLFVGMGLFLVVTGSAWGPWLAVFVSLAPTVLFARRLAAGAPSLTVTRTGLIPSGSREIAFGEVDELSTGAQTLTFTWAPQAGDVLRSPWERRQHRKAAFVSLRGVADPELLAQWILHLTDPSRPITVKPLAKGLGRAWRLAEREERHDP